MKFYSLLCITLTFAALVFTRNIDIINEEDARHVTENTIVPNIESTSNLNNNKFTTSKTEPKCPENIATVMWRRLEIILNCYCEYPYLRYPINGTCYELFKQGPCTPGNFLVQPFKSIWEISLPQCAVNPCVENGLVLHNGTCHNITSQPLCNNGLFHFEESTSEITCIPIMTRQSAIEPYIRNKCEPGYREDRNGECRKKL